MATDFNPLELFEQNEAFMNTTVQDGIEKNRKGDAVITVRDERGAPVPDTVVRVRQTAHQFRFGANLFMLDELETPEKNELYKSRFADIFNMATVPFYWNTLEEKKGSPRYAADSKKVYRRPAPDLCLAFCREHGIEPREHGLAYDHFFPEWLRGADTATVKKELERRYAEVAARYADHIPTIEVTNEMEWQEGVTAFYDEPDYVEWCFKLARKYFPHNELGINEHTTLCWQDRGRPTDKYYAYIEANLLKGAPINAIGMQYHLFRTRELLATKHAAWLDPVSLWRHMDLYARFGLPLQVTEVTLPAYSAEAADEETQAKLLEYLYSLWFAHPRVEQIIYWNLVDGYAYVKDADPANPRALQGDMTRGENVYHGGLLRFDMSPKPAYLKLKDLIENKWHTETETRTNARGEAAFRGFYGTYELVVSAAGRTRILPFALSREAGRHTIVI